MTNGPRVVRCRHIVAVKTRKHLGPELASAARIKSSPLLAVVKGKEPVDLRGSNIFITDCAWPNLTPHLRWALGLDLDLSFEIITDQDIKQVFVGSEGYHVRPKGTREEIRTFNQLKDLVGPPDLLIIRLGHLGHKNKAAGGALKEALMLRETARKPTWLVDDPKRPWSSSPSHTADAEDYIDQHFEVIEIEGVDPGENYDDPSDLGMDFEGDDDEPLVPGLKPKREPKKKRPKKKRPPTPPPPEEDEDETDGDFEIELPGDGPKWRHS